MKQKFNDIKHSADGRIRDFCARLTPEKRLAAVLLLAGVFAIVNFYMIFRAIHDIGRDDAGTEFVGIPPTDIPGAIPADMLPDAEVRGMEEFFNPFNTESHE